MQLSIPVTQASTGRADYYKAAAVVEDDIIVLRNLVGSVLEIINLDEPVEEVFPANPPANTGRVFRGTQDGNPIIVTELKECQCGGTRVTPR